MVSFETVQNSNSAIKEYGPNLVAVFVGGTSGIGESTARAFVKHAVSPRVYLIGRSETRASQIIEDLRALNPDGQISFIKGDVSRLQEVDKACKEIQAKEDKINLLVLSAGILTTKGRDETDEGLDKKLSLHYYSRMRFLYNLLPQLTNAAQGAASGQRSLSRVLSVLDGRGNAPLIMNDLSLKDNYSLRNCAKHAITMTSLSMEELASSHPSISFVHAYPGIVKTGILRDNGFLIKTALSALFLLLSPMTVGLEESGERHIYAGTNPSFAPRGSKGGGNDTAIGSDGVQGSGSYLVSSDSATVSNQKAFEGYRADGTRASVWKHTLDTFKVIRGA